MIRQPKELPFAEWPEKIQQSWDAAFFTGDFLDENGPGADLAPATRASLKSACGRFLRFLHNEAPISAEAVAGAIHPAALARYAEYKRGTCSDGSIAIELHHLRLALRLIYPTLDLGWLLNASKRIAQQGKATPRKHHLITSDRLYQVGLKLMDAAIESADTRGNVSKADAFMYRDGLVIFLLSVIPLRRRTLAALRVGKQLIRSGALWTLDIPPEDTKTAEAIEFVLSATLSARIDLYLERFRPRVPNAGGHAGLWVSNKGNPMDDGTIYDMVCRRTRKALGFAVSLHRFRHAAMTFWSIHDPANIRGGKDLLGHRSFGTTEKFYIIGQSRVAARVLADAWRRRATDL